MIKFSDLYDSLRRTEYALKRMGTDVDNALCGYPKCVLSNEQEKLLDNFMELANIDIDFCELDFPEIINKINECFDCIREEFITDVPNILPEPEATVDNCPGGTIIPLQHIKRFRIYERTYTHSSIPSPVQVYVMTKGSLPYTFAPSVPPSHSSNERYFVSWNALRNSLVVKLDNDINTSLNIPVDSYNIVRIVAEIADEYIGGYGAVEVEACSALVMTEGVTWKTNHGIENAVDGNLATYPIVANTVPELIVEFQFKL